VGLLWALAGVTTFVPFESNGSMFSVGILGAPSSASTTSRGNDTPCRSWFAPHPRSVIGDLWPYPADRGFCRACSTPWIL
jgi:hypothetical protein